MTDFTDLQRDSDDLGALVNENRLVSSRYGGDKKSWQYLQDEFSAEFAEQLLEINKSRGYRVVGTFAAGFNYELFNDVGIDASGNSWIYIGAGAPAKTVTAGTVPSAPDYQQVTFNSIDGVVGLRDELNNRALELTLAEAQAKTDLTVGQYVRLTDRGGAVSKVVDNMSPNDIDILYLNDNLQLYIPIQGAVSAAWFGAKGGQDVAPILNRIYSVLPQAVATLPFQSTPYLGGSSVDIKNGVLLGEGSGALGLPQTRIDFSDAHGIYSSTPNNRAYSIKRVELYGSAIKTANGQVLIDFEGQNYPYLEDVRCWRAQTGIRLAEGSGVECNYGSFYRVDVNQCLNAIDIVLGSPAAANSHTFFGGRLWDNNKGIEIPVGHSNTAFHGVAFESNDDAAVDSSGTNISFHGCRWENPGAISIRARSDAGSHWSFGDHFSSGIDVQDETERGVVYVTGKTASSVLPVSHLGKSVTSSNNLLTNGVFTFDNNGDGVPEPWRKSFSSAGTDAIDMSGDVITGSRSVKIVNTDSTNLRLFQTVPVVVGETYTVTFRAKATSGSAQLRLSSNSSSGTDYGNMTIPDSYALLSRRFTATTDTLFVSVYLSGSSQAEVHVDMVTVTHGINSDTDASDAAISSAGGIMLGDLEFLQGVGLVQTDSSGDRFRLDLPVGGGNATWVQIT